jgi:L-rhamnose isomerase/sugar isomerase
LRQEAAQYGLGFDAVNSNTFQDQADQALSYRHGSLANARADIRAQAVAHNIECIEIGKALGAPALTVWIGDGTNFAGQQSLGGMFERYLSRWSRSMPRCPPDWACSSSTRCTSRRSIRR